MTKFAIIALVLVNAAFASQVFLGNTNKMSTGAFAALKAIEQNEFGKNLLDTIALQLQNQAPLSDVAKLLGELKSDLLHQQQEDDELHTRREQECSEAIAEYDRRIAVASEEIRQATERIGQLTNRISELEVSIADYEHQIEDAETTVRNSIEERAFRAGQFESRTAQHQGVLEALDLILSKLAAYGNQQQPDEATLLQLAKLLGELKSDLLHQQQEDDELHTRREEECSTAIAEYDSRIAVASEEIRQASERIGQLTARIGELEVSIADYEHQIEDAENTVNAAIADRAHRAGQFESRTVQHHESLKPSTSSSRDSLLMETNNKLMKPPSFNSPSSERPTLLLPSSKLLLL
jgi:chromosome segregation ATPase